MVTQNECSGYCNNFSLIKLKELQLKGVSGTFESSTVFSRLTKRE